MLDWPSSEAQQQDPVYTKLERSICVLMRDARLCVCVCVCVCVCSLTHAHNNKKKNNQSDFELLI